MKLALLPIALGLWAAGSAHALVIGVTEGVTYRATDNQIEERFAPIAEALSKSLRQPVTIKVLSSYKAAREALKTQSVDVAFLHPAHLAFEASKSGGYKALAWTSGYTEYKVSLLCKEAQPITDWKTITGKSLVTPDPDSITAVVTRAMLREKGLAESAVKLTTTRYQDAVPFYVQNGFAVYGATASAGVVKAWKAEGGKTCAESRPVPIKQWLSSTKLDATTTAQLRESLLDLSGNDTGKRALAASGYSGFVAPSAETERTLTAWLGY
ncbi:PhnD/SsuA/transferrin family substrate-binding protein [Variovorax dokdonensis]|uniref:PhnD/SsuA/transferrin family substrate-binding protein n=1 Tax=Variovorax dokdonensis TaxID=344883 RepID=A0ABT7N717_9BURK|nr:PhnD/SsuA/transferrin family substrate-binding protein [Variovorax dokdonensis]MDM0043733.1 PhnD/SsuA/transferrin family substrate-binding protein [Variovorax dokdonensis]